MLHTRRTFLKTGTQLGVAGATLASLPRPLLAHSNRAIRESPPIEENDHIKKIAHRALDAARNAGAKYADVRLAHFRTRKTSRYPDEYEFLNVGVRALVDGYWGFASSPLWDSEEATQLGRAATEQAKSSKRGLRRDVELATIAPVREQHWAMPVQIDPFSVHPDEVIDYLQSLEIYAHHRVSAAGLGINALVNEATFTRIEKAVASTDGVYCTQRCYRSHGIFVMSIGGGEEKRKYSATLKSLTPTGVGWELYRGQPLRDQIDQVIEETKQDLALPVKPVDVGRYDIAMDAWSVAHLISPTIGLATELDRALGYEANSNGTSYLNEPLEMLGTFHVGSPLLTINGNRTDPGSVATVKWDDEGVEPVPFSIVDKGVLSNFSTTREGAGWLKDYYARQGVTVRSNGCALGGDDLIGGMHAPLAQAPNMTVVPGAETADFDAVISSIGNGVAFKELRFDMDFQQMNGLASGMTYEVRKGKRSAVLYGGGLLFKSSDLWKNMMRLGGGSSARRYGVQVMKGEPRQYAFHSVTAVPVMFKDASVIDMLRKA